MNAFSRILTIIIILWLLGFGFYVISIQYYPQEIDSKPDAVVVLTGGSNRIEEGLDIMSKFGCRNFFISGVNRNVTRHDILMRVQKNRNVEECHLELGYKARNTHENAQEVLAWLEKKKYKQIILVTAYYHMPRSLLEFEAVAPDLNIQPYAVYPEKELDESREAFSKRALLLFREYHKLIATWIRINFI